METRSDIFVSEYGLRMRKICASCRFYSLGDKFNRLCTKHGCEVENYDICDDFDVNPSLMKIGKNKGECRKKEFIEYLNGQLALNDMPEHPKRTKLEITKEWRKKHGSEIINI